MENVQARFWPRSGRDALITLTFGLLQFVVLFILPCILIAVLFQSVLVGIGAYFAMGMIWILFSVRTLRISSDGIEFVRVLGSPKRLSWSQIESVEKAPMKEILVHGYIWPLFPPREMTFSLSCIGHYRISYRSNWAYYPPKDAELFESLIRSYIGD